MCYDFRMDWALLAALSERDRDAVLAATRRRGFAKGESVFHEGDPADGVHLVVSGHFAVRVTTPQGERATLNVLQPGDAVGELSLVDRTHVHHRSASVVALEDSETLALSAEMFHGLCDRHPSVRELMVVLLAARVRDLSVRLVEVTFVGLDQRLCRRLVELVEIYRTQRGGTGCGPVEIPLTQDELADLVGGTRPSVNQALQRLRRLGIIELARGRLLVRDPTRLRLEADRGDRPETRAARPPPDGRARGRPVPPSAPSGP